MGNAIDRLYAERDDEQDGVTGVVITSAKKTFFAGGDLKGMLAAGPDDAQAVFEMCEAIKAGPAPARDARQARRGCHQRRRTRRRPRDHPGLPPPDRGGRPQGRPRPARGHPRPAARRRWRHPHGADARHPVRADGRPAPGHRASSRLLPRRRASSTSSSRAATTWCPRRRSGSRPTRTTRSPPRTPGTATATRSRAVRRRARAWRRSCPPSRRCCASRPRVRSTRHRARSWPRPSRAPRSTSTPRAGSSRATSPS